MNSPPTGTPNLMGYRRVGASGLRVSEIALGSWLTYGASVADSTAQACIREAIESGVIFLDTADVYNHGAAEELLGRMLADYQRSDLVLATKAFFPMSENPNDRGLSRKHLFESVHASLRRLRTDYIDLYQCHRFDPDTPVSETVRAMDDLVTSGKILYWGVSLWSAAQIAEAVEIARHTGAAPPVSNQPPYNMLQRSIEEDVLPLCRREGVGQVVYCPLSQGLLTGKYAGGKLPEGSRAADEKAGQFLRPRMTPANHEQVDRLAKLAAEAGLSLVQLALAWVLRDDCVAAAIIGATTPEQVRENVAASGIRLDEDFLYRVEMVLSAS